jgi:hypothetical protein
MFYLDVAEVDLVLQCLYTYVASVCFRCFGYFKRMLQVVYLDVALAIHVRCECKFSNVSAVSNVCCKCMFQMFSTVSNVCYKCFI